MEVKNLGEVEEYLTWLVSNRPGLSLSKSTILELHRLTIQGLYTCAGSFRSPVFQIEVTEARFHPAEPFEIEFRLQDLIDKYIGEPRTTAEEKMRAIAAFFHGFLQIHPFCGGNGRVSRALLTLLLRQEGMIGEADEVHSHLTARKDRLLKALHHADSGALLPLQALVWRASLESRLDGLAYHLRRPGPVGESIRLSPESQFVLEPSNRLTMTDEELMAATEVLFTEVNEALSVLLPE